MYFLLYIIGTPAFLGEYSDLKSCKAAIKEIYSVQINPPGKKQANLEETILISTQIQKQFACVPKTSN